jgi:phosphoribosylformylglycinamidine cyclo-ligase
MSAKAYKAAGVDLEAADSIKENIVAFASLTHGPDVLKNGNSFAGLYRLSGYKKPVLISSTDGVGTKLKIASFLDHYESIGVDLVHLNVNDIITCGGKPLFFLDYISVGSLDPQIIEPLLRGMAWACRNSGTALIGGETAQAPGMYTGKNFDLAGTIVGVVEESDIMCNANVINGDILLGLPSSGLHTNGYSLVRKVFDIDRNPKVLYERFDGLGHTLGEELLNTHRCYYKDLESHYSRIKAIAHISGGGLIDNLPRVLPEGLACVVNLDTWEPSPIFPLIQSTGSVDSSEMYRVFNMGIGMVLIAEFRQAALLQKEIPDAIVIGQVIEQKDEKRVILTKA